MTVESHPRCYLDVQIEQEPVGRIVIELFAETCPITCENFRCLCTGEKGLSKTSSKPLCFKNVPFHRVIKGFMVQAGDFENGNGTGGESIYGGVFDDENFEILHDQPYLVSMANKGKNTNGSQFFISLQPNPHLDGKHTVFGRVISGREVLTAIESLKTDQNSRPVKQVLISQSGELILKSEEKRKKKKKTAISSASSEEEGERKKKRKKKKKKHEKKGSKEHNLPETKEEEDESLACSVDPDEIPAIPANNFLLRRTSPVGDFRRNTPRGREAFSYRRRPLSRTRSGRKVKGRGNIRYRTPGSSDERSGSETPPHWKMAQSKLKNLKDVIPKKPVEDSEDDLTPTEGFEDNPRNPVLQSRLGTMSARILDSNRRDARANINENRRKDWSPEAAVRYSHRDGGRNAKSDLFKQLLDSGSKRGDKWNMEQDKSKDEDHASPIRSKIVVKSFVGERISRDKEEEDWKHGERRSRRDFASYPRRHGPPLHFDQRDRQVYLSVEHRAKDVETDSRFKPRNSVKRKMNEKTLHDLVDDLEKYSRHAVDKSEVKKKFREKNYDTSEERVVRLTHDDKLSVQSAESEQKTLVDTESFSTSKSVEIPFLEKTSEDGCHMSATYDSSQNQDAKDDLTTENSNSDVNAVPDSESFQTDVIESNYIYTSPTPKYTSTEVIPLPDEIPFISSAPEIHDVNDEKEKAQLSDVHTSSPSHKTVRDESTNEKSPEHSPKALKSLHHYSRSPSREPSKDKNNRRSVSSPKRQTPSRKSPMRRKSPTHRSRSSSRSRSRSRRRSGSRHRRQVRRYSRSPDNRRRRSRSPPHNSRGMHSYRFSGGRNRTPNRRSSFQRRYSRASPYRGRARARSPLRRSNTRSRSRSADKHRRHRRHSSSSSSSSSSSDSERSKKKATKARKRKSSSSSSSSRSKRSDT